MDGLESTSPSSGVSTSVISSEVTEDHSVLNKTPRLPLGLIHPSVKLVEEIATLEEEIMQLERYLLSLYRKAFQQHFSDDAKEVPPRLSNVHSFDKVKSEIYEGDDDLRVDSTLSSAFSDKKDVSPVDASDSTMEKEKRSGHGRRVSLAHHLGNRNTLVCPDILSEEIIRCIASVYCKLSCPVKSRSNHSVSSDFSCRSSAKFSPRSSCGDEAVGLTREKGPYASMLEVSRISLDKESYNFAAKMLHKFRSLVKSLEIIDPKTMSREEKLAFWINIHNALVMHGYLAYGTSAFMRSNSVSKAAYNVGGICLNASDIQSCVLRIKPHSSAQMQWFQTLLPTGKKSKMQNSDHPYAIDYPEPLVHFTLSSGASSDPAIRVYSAKTVFEDLKIAKEEFIQSTVYIQDQKKLYLPKALRFYAKDMSLSTAEVVDVVSNSLTAVQRKVIRRLLKSERFEKYIYWIDPTSSFRYRIHQDLAQSI